jgi:hypothetical protein
MAYDLTDKQGDALKSLVHLGRSWREEFYIIWHDPDEISDILDYDSTPPQISRGDIHALEQAGLLICEFVNNNKVRVTLTSKSYEAIDTDFKFLLTNEGLNNTTALGGLKQSLADFISHVEDKRMAFWSSSL